jgi:hypothetical protein
MEKKKAGLLLLLGLGTYALYAANKSKKKRKGSVIVAPVQTITKAQYNQPPAPVLQTPVIQTAQGTFFTPQYTNTYSPLPSLSDTSYDQSQQGTGIMNTDYQTMAGMGEISKIMAENENVSVGYVHNGQQYWLHKRQRCGCHRQHAKYRKHKILNTDYAQKVIKKL